MIKTTSATASVAMAAVLMTTGCTGYGQAPASPPASSSSATAPAPAVPCNAQPAQSAVGQNSTASVMESARVRSGAQMARILRPGQMITKEFNAQRLNLEVDANGRILAVRCG
jgi:hypothetical protein